MVLEDLQHVLASTSTKSAGNATVINLKTPEPLERINPNINS